MNSRNKEESIGFGQRGQQVEVKIVTNDRRRTEEDMKKKGRTGKKRKKIGKGSKD